MVLQLQLWSRSRSKTLISRLNLALLSLMVGSVGELRAAEIQQAPAPSAMEYLEDAASLYKSGQFFKAARYAFASIELDPSLKPNAYSWITLGLLHAGLPNAASYFFVRTLQSGNHAAIRSVLTQAEEILMVVGADVVRRYLAEYTKYEDYDSKNRSAYLYSLGKDALLSGDSSRAIGYFNAIENRSPLWPYALQLRATSYAILGKEEQAIRDFKNCASNADRIRGYRGPASEAKDLEARCTAGEARTLYQMNQFETADRVYDSIPKRSLVWPDILFEQAWNAFGRREYNRTLGKLVSYKSPALSFIFNSEIDVLRAQSYLALCLYSDANEVISEFNSKYTAVGEEVKAFVENNANNLPAFYHLGKTSLGTSLYTKNKFHQLTNQFVRGPYFRNLVANERELNRELEKIHQLDAEQQGVSHNLSGGFPGFLTEVLQWRQRSVQQVGGAFVKNSLIDHYASLIDAFEKMSFIKLEMLKLAKDKLLEKLMAIKHQSGGDRLRGNVEPSRRDDQLKFHFNGEFWNDELGDYVFGLESECKS